ncbi:hypothetical protein Ocin01_14152 [Orchesella cincta]|uniref:Uncharacterized protein n=1 Tax=Orchesella cincta TaxID=48709 RepID=A0A1D2MHP1_ORCCI|nr:hypothetical protein Ocin01_14152 [Orchesella cincta]
MIVTVIFHQLWYINSILLFTMKHHFNSLLTLVYAILLLKSTTDGLMCYGCLLLTPFFDIKNNPAKISKGDSSCTYHTNTTCVPPETKCFIHVVKSGRDIKITKGCTEDTSDGCLQSNTDTEQKCFCKTRLCNTDIEAIGGKSIVGFLLTFIVFNLLYRDIQMLSCCLGSRHLQTEDEDNLTNDCTNTARTCSSVDCADNKCQPSTSTNNSHPETECGKVKCDVTGSNGFCRIYYYEVRKCDPDCVNITSPDANKKNANTGEWWVRQECYEDTDRELKESCNFKHIIVHLDVMTRVTVEKDCYCKEDDCNADIGKACRTVLVQSLKLIDLAICTK